LFRSAGLDLNFAGGVFSLNNTRTDSPAKVPGWSFSRTDTNGIATALDLDGNVIQFPSRTNLILQSQTFDDAGWTKGGSTVTANATAAPDESITADKLVEDTSTGLHRLSQIVAKAASATTYTFTVFAKASERTQLRLALDDVGANNGGATFDLSNGTISTAAAVTGDFTNASASITAVGSWYRLALTVTSNTVTSIRAQTQIAVSGSISYTGVAGSGLFLWGAQLELGSTATAYIPTTTAAVTVVLPRITNRGILVEEARTNKLTVFSANPDSGTTGLAKTGDAAAVLSRVSDPAAIAAAGLSGVCTSGFLFELDNTLGTTESLATSTAQFGNTNTHVLSTWAQRVSGSTAAYLRGSAGEAPTFFSNASLVRITTAAFTPLGSGFKWQIAAPAGVKVRFILPQMEEGAFATSPIITTGAAGTRGVDVVNVGSAVLPPEGTVLASYVVPAAAVGTINRAYVWTTQESGNNRFALRAGDPPGSAGDGTRPLFIVGDGSALSSMAGTSLNSDTIAKTAASYSTLSAMAGAAFNGVDQTAVRQLYAAATSQTFHLAQSNSAGALLNSYLVRLQIIPRFLTAAERIALTAP
jgi:hypothetical protein